MDFAGHLLAEALAVWIGVVRMGMAKQLADKSSSAINGIAAGITRIQ